MIKTDLILPIGYTSEDIKIALSQRLPINKDEISEIRILKETLTVERERGAFYRVCVGAEFSAEREAGLLKMKKKVSEAPLLKLRIPKSKLSCRPIVVGSGPAGLFAALIFAEAGARPIVLERGLAVEERIKRVNRFVELGVLDTECNIQFGEGGAGTYSDGKLKVGSMDEYKNYILTAFVEAGADPDILYSSSAHLGTDKLSDIVKNLREKMISLGAQFIYGARLCDIKTKDGRAVKAVYEKDGASFTLDCDVLVLATGHSAHDVFLMLEEKNVAMCAKGFGVGVRIEHPREYMNETVYGRGYDPRLPTASYHLVTHLPSGRSVYSFCMCPGGTVVAATSSEGRVVTNGMSEFSRMGENSNAAILVSVTPDDFGSDSPLAGLHYQMEIEKRAFSFAGSDYKAPSQRLSGILSGEKPALSESVRPTYPRGVVAADVSGYLPDYVSESLKAGFLDFDNWMPSYAFADALITGPETRSTSPVRVLRGKGYESVSLKGLFPVGEGAGYAGGIVSSAADGLRCAEYILSAGERGSADC